MSIWLDVDVALSEVPVNVAALIDSTDFISREEAVTYDQAGMDLVWNFITTAGAMTQTAVVPTTAGVHDWTNQGNGMYSIEIPASAGTINNNVEGFGWFTGFATGILPWTGPVIGFCDAAINNLLINTALSVTRGFAGTAVPDVAADAAGGLPISDAGALDLDTILGRIIGTLATGTHNPQSGDNYARIGATGSGLTSLAQANLVTAARMGALTDWINGGRLDLLLDAIKAVTDALPDAGALTTIGTDTARLTAARAAVLDDWINTGRLDTILDTINTDAARLTEVRAAVLTDWINAGRLDTILDAILVDTGTTLPAEHAALNDPTAAAVADAVWDEAKAGHVGAGSMGEEVQAHSLSTEVSALNDLSAAQVNAEADQALTDYAGPTKAEMDAAHGLLATEAKQDIIDALIDELKVAVITNAAGADVATDVVALKAVADAIKLQTDDPGSIPRNDAFTLAFMMVDETDRVTPEPGKTVTGTRSIDKGAFGAVTGAITEIAQGFYVITGVAADSNGTEIIFRFTASGAADRFITVRTSA